MPSFPKTGFATQKAPDRVRWDLQVLGLIGCVQSHDGAIALTEIFLQKTASTGALSACASARSCVAGSCQLFLAKT